MKKIRNKIYLQLVIPSILIYGVILLVGLRFVNRSIEEESVRNKQHNLENISRGMNDWLVSRMSEIVNLADIPLLRSRDEVEILNYLKHWRNRFSFNYNEMYYISPQSEWINTKGERGILPTPFFKLYFEGESYHPYYMGPDEIFMRDKALLFAIPIKENDISLGYLAGSIKMSRINKVLKFFSFEDFDKFMLVDPQGIIVVHSESEKEGLSESLVYNEEFSSSKRYNDEYIFVRELRTDWKLVASVPVQKMMASSYAMNRLAYISSLILFLLLAGFTYYLTYLLASPVRIMKRSLLKIMHGDYSEKIHLSTKDEFQQLADTINLLTDGMIQRRFDDRFLFLGHFAARMAHDMRHPLNLISLMTEDLQDDLPEYRKRLSDILQEVQNTDKFIGGILDFSKDDSVELTLVSLKELISDSLEHMAPVFTKNDIIIEFRCEVDADYLYLDIQKMNQILANLLQNAIDSIIESETKNDKTILIHIGESEDFILLEITDSGPGFDESYIDRFFDPYFTTRGLGTGLGLSICYRYLNLLNGEIELMNTKNHHGKVCISLRK